MSKALMLSVWECDLPHPKKTVLTAMAYNGADDGSSIFPSVETIARRSGYKPRQVHNIQKQLRDDGILVKDGRRPLTGNGRGRGYTTIYRMDLSGVPKLPADNETESTRIADSALESAKIADLESRVCNPEPLSLQSATLKSALAIADNQYLNSTKNNKDSCAATSAALPDHFPVSEKTWQFALSQVTDDDRTQGAWQPDGTPTTIQISAREWLRDTLDGFLLNLEMDPMTGNQTEWEWWKEPQSELDEWFLRACRTRALPWCSGEFQAINDRWNAAIQTWLGSTASAGRAPSCTEQRRASPTYEAFLPLPELTPHLAVVQ